MPELPEVETIVADLRPHLAGRTIISCDLLFPTIVRHPEPEVFIDSVAGMRITALRRRGKYILIDLENDLVLVVHLGMTGQLRLFEPDAPLSSHTHAVFTLDGGSTSPPGPSARPPHEWGGELQLRYRDPRRFGRLLLGSLSRKSARRLHESLRDSLLVAIANRGSSVDTYRDAWGEIGGQQEKLLVYGRAGEPCFTCGRPLALIRIAGRSTVFCRRCQR